jgi:hypothetical protein
MIYCSEESPLAKTNASASCTSSPQTIPEIHAVSLFMAKLVGFCFHGILSLAVPVISTKERKLCLPLPHGTTKNQSFPVNLGISEKSLERALLINVNLNEDKKKEKG